MKRFTSEVLGESNNDDDDEDDVVTLPAIMAVAAGVALTRRFVLITFDCFDVVAAKKSGSTQRSHNTKRKYLSLSLSR